MRPPIGEERREPFLRIPEEFKRTGIDPEVPTMDRGIDSAPMERYI
ncbi:hypothetical protein [Puniceicoccus vermicola]|uniref:Uncharacterized protein n=1 Tax=Puniceicoccus vermicola TaxID=388746 RepID=A0A7X1E7H7_9BACT|nr:hypothetical protein [Puniceicoccus vermicola]MBC2603757.1 hypothetical protein [Puniceicoccus vermicola]